MAERPTRDAKGASSEPPSPEVLAPREETAAEQGASDAAAKPAGGSKPPIRPRRGAYRPSHKATFIGLAVVALVLAINAGVIFFVIKSQSKPAQKSSQDQVTISQDALDKLGVNRSSVNDLGVTLTIGPDTRFARKVQIGGDLSVGGKLNLNGTFLASDANFAKLQAGDTSLAQLNVNGDGTLSTLNLRKDLNVTGLTRLQGAVTVSQLLTVNNSVNIAGNLAVGGLLSARGFQASSLVSDTTLTIGGHVITRGAAPSARPGNALGNNGTMSISGNDASGTVAANIGTGASGGIIASVTFQQPYSNIPHVVVTAVGGGVGSVYVNRSATGFSIGVNGPMAPGGYAFDYIVMQ